MKRGQQRWTYIYRNIGMTELDLDEKRTATLLNSSVSLFAMVLDLDEKRTATTLLCLYCFSCIKLDLDEKRTATWYPPWITAFKWVRPRWKEDSNSTSTGIHLGLLPLELDLNEKRTATWTKASSARRWRLLDLDEKRTATYFTWGKAGSVLSC